MSKQQGEQNVQNLRTSQFKLLLIEGLWSPLQGCESVISTNVMIRQGVGCWEKAFFFLLEPERMVHVKHRILYFYLQLLNYYSLTSTQIVFQSWQSFENTPQLLCVLNQQWYFVTLQGRNQKNGDLLSPIQWLRRTWLRRNWESSTKATRQRCTPRSLKRRQALTLGLCSEFWPI